MIYKQCIDACYDATKACDRYAIEGHKQSKEYEPGHCRSIVAAEVCTLVARLTAKGLCHKDLFEVCAKICDECAERCKLSQNPYAKDCVTSCKKCAETCRSCHEDCNKSEKKATTV